jgi:hypothetical protein
MGGLALFGLGSLLQAIVAQVDSSRWAFVPGVLISGVGLSCIFVPMIAVAMMRVPPPLSGAASGLINTTRQLGGVLGGAAVGALLQDRLAAALPRQAAAHAGELPAPARAGFVDGFRQAAHGGLEVGAGQAAGSVHAPPGTPAAVAAQVQRVAGDVFHHGFVDALHPSLLLPAGVLLLAAAGCAAIRGRGRPAPQEAGPATAPEPAPAPA